jgi:hypothetical protein
VNAIPNQFDHIHPEFRAHATLPDSERIDKIRADRWIPYPQAEDALVRLNDLLSYPPRGRMPCCLLTGTPNAGKSKIVEKFMKEHPAQQNEGTRKAFMPVVLFQMPSEPDLSLFYQEMLRSLGAPISSNHSTNGLRTLGRQMLADLQTKMIIIDEFEATLGGTPRAQRLLLNELRFLNNDLRLEITVVGPADAKTALKTDMHLADRFEELELAPWRADKLLLDLLASFESQLPLRQPSKVASMPIAKRIVEMTDGITGRVLALLESVAVEAIRSGRERIDEASFADTALLRRFVSQSQRKPLGR